MKRHKGQADRCWSITVKTWRSQHDIEPVSLSLRLFRITGDITVTYVRAPNWKRCAVLPREDDKNVFGCFGWGHLQLDNQRFQRIVRVLHHVQAFRDGPHNWLASRRSCLDCVYRTLKNDVTACLCFVWPRIAPCLFHDKVWKVSRAARCRRTCPTMLAKQTFGYARQCGLAVSLG